MFRVVRSRKRKRMKEGSERRKLDSKSRGKGVSAVVNLILGDREI